MPKENGRHKRPDRKETAKVLMRTFNCKDCGETASFSSIQFGEEIKCSVCGKVMVEEVR